MSLANHFDPRGGGEKNLEPLRIVFHSRSQSHGESVPQGSLYQKLGDSGRQSPNRQQWSETVGLDFTRF